MKVSIDAHLCTGVATCAGIAPSVFGMAPDGIAYVKNTAGELMPTMTPTDFPDSQIDTVIEAAEECPMECIYIDA